MICLNKNLLYIIVLLIPITIISFFYRETNFNMAENNQQTVDDNKTITINDNNENLSIDLEEYIIGVVAGEMPAIFEEEALKAQAIASRTYAISYLKNHPSIKTTIDNQVYLSKEDMQSKWQDKYSEYYKKISDAVISTKDLIMYYQNEPIKAYYYSMSNGYTESSINVFNEQTDYLTIIPSPWDKDNEETITISKEEFCTKLSISCNKISISNIIKDKSNRVSKITINNKEFTGLEIRKLLSLRSTDFTVDISDVINITTKGYGHGVGMSQYGANNMAKEGYSYEEILKYYYQNIEISNI